MPVGAERLDRRRDRLDLFAAHRAAFAGVRIEAGEGEARPRDAEAAPHVGGDDARGRDDELPRQTAAEASAQRDVDRDRHDGERRRPDHHHRLRLAAPIAFSELAEKFGVAGKLEAGGVERRLGDRIGDDGARCAGLYRSDGAFDRFDRRGGEVGARRARFCVGAGGERSDRQRAREDGGGLAGRALGDRHGEVEPARQAGERGRVGENEEGRRSGVAREPGAQRQFRADAGGVAHRHGERRSR